MTHRNLRRRARLFGLTNLLLLSLCCSFAAAQKPGERLPDGNYAVSFEFKPPGSPTSVNVAGDFNNWDKSATPLTRADDGAWRATVPMSEGIHHYKFVVDNDNWTPDPNADPSLNEPDNHGGVNSGIFAGPDGRKLPKAEPNAIRMEAVHHDVSDLRDRNVVSKNLLLLGIRTQANDVQQVIAHITGKNASESRDYPLAKTSSQYGFDRFGGLIQTDADTVDYSFELIDGSAKQTVEKQSVQMTPKFVTPDWAKHAVWYQIFPERFRNGDPSNDPGDKDYERKIKWTTNWWKAQQGEAPGDENFYKGVGNVWKRRYGGDIQGLKWALPYMREVGINAIYLNPIFEADSMHKYDASDYRHIDDNFGVKGDLAELQGETEDPSTWKWSKSDKLFLDFVAEAHKQGFKVIIDGVFNHVGRSHYAFQDVLKNGKSSKYADWFDVRDWNPPIKYISWDKGADATDDGALPVFKKDPQLGLVHGPREHIFAITKRWLAPDGDPSQGVDGWRLDVPGDIPHPFWIEWRKIVKEAHPDAYISGEIWTWSQPWLQGDQFDAVMNYRFTEPVQQFFVNQKTAISPSTFAQRMLEVAYNYPFQVSLAQMNLFDSHDTDRFASMFVNPDLGFDTSNRIQDNNPKYNPAKPTPLHFKRMQQAAKFQMAYVGAPMIYYGDEVGMCGPDDPSNRQPMIWRDLEPYEDPQVKFNPQVFETYRRGIAARQLLPALQLGFFTPILTDDKSAIFAFERELGDQRVYVVLNRSNEKRHVTLHVQGTGFVDYLDPASTDLLAPSQDPQSRTALKLKENATVIHAENGSCTVDLPPYGVMFLSSRSTQP
ncbi:MAG TPA: alpha-amylase family glycosyl hydrolase [Tepidisphaeraceae bacterium]|jgi:glycosidase